MNTNFRSEIKKNDFDASDVLLQMRNITIEGLVHEKWNPIVKGLNLTLRRGEIVGLIGESGAGKSTLGLASLGYVTPGCRFVEGSYVEFDGQSLLDMSEKERADLRGTRIAYVAQSAQASFNPAHRLIDQTIEPRLRKGDSVEAARADAVELYRMMQLPDYENIGERYPHQVSGGQLQRIMTAMAMTCSPDFIVFDEPTTALDVTTQVDVLATMRHIVHEFGTAAIYISHDLAVVAQMADRVMVLCYGDLIEEGPTASMLSNPKHAYTRTLWAVRSIEKPEIKTEDLILKLSNIDASYGKSGDLVLKDVSIVIPRGRTISLVGESGSGKSTIARVITGLLKPSKGQIQFDGEKLPAVLKDRTKDSLKKIQMIYQSADVAMNPKHSVQQILGRPIDFYLELSSQRKKERISELLEMIELDASFMHRLPCELSGGQKQRVCIARALAAEPSLIICDEVTSALDQIVQEEILKLLMKLQERYGVSYLFITHDIATVRAISDEIVVMYEGRVVEQGIKSKILNPPYEDYTKLLLSSVPKMDTTWLDTLLATRQTADSETKSPAQS